MRAAPYCPGNTPPWYGRFTPAESTRYTIGMRWRIAISWWPETIKKMLRAQEIAMRQRIPIVYLVDSAGVNLAYQGGVFPGLYGAARIFYYNAIMRHYLKVPQIAAVMGPCIAGGAYLPALSDVIFMVEG